MGCGGGGVGLKSHGAIWGRGGTAGEKGCGTFGMGGAGGLTGEDGWGMVIFDAGRVPWRRMVPQACLAWDALPSVRGAAKGDGPTE